MLESRQKPTKFRLVHFNADGIKKRKQELINFQSVNQIAKRLITETFLKPNGKLNIPNFKTYRSDRHTGPKEGRAVMIKK